MTTLIKLARFDPPPAPPPPPAPVVRTYTVLVRTPQWQLVPVFDRALADVILNPRVNAPTIVFTTDRLTLPDGQGVVTYASRFVYNWYKRVLVGYIDVPTPRQEVITPPVPPQPALTRVPDAWDASARSIDAFPDPVRVTFKVGAGSKGGVVAGLSHLTPLGADARVVHGFKVEQGVAYVITNKPAGARASDVPTFTGATARQVSGADTLWVESSGGVVSHWVNDSLMARGPSYLGGSAAHLAASLYSSSDSVVGAMIDAMPASGRGAMRLALAARGGAVAHAAGRLRMKLCAKGEGSSNGLRLRLWAQGSEGLAGTGVVELAVLSATGFGVNGATGGGRAVLFSRLAAIGSDAAYAAGGLRISLAPFGKAEGFADGLGGFGEVGTQWLEAVAPFPHRGLHQRTVGAINFDATVSPVAPFRTVARAADAARASLRQMAELLSRCRASASLQGERLVIVSVVTSGRGQADVRGVLVVSAVLHSSARAALTTAAGRLADASLPAAGRGGFLARGQQVLQAALKQLVEGGVMLAGPEGYSVWSVNAATGASAAYEGFRFNSFARFAGRHFAAMPDGIYELGGDDDAGQLISAHAHLGQRNFGTSSLKTMPTAYLGVSSAGRMLLRVTTEQGTFTYQARSCGRDMQTQRVDLGRGLRANYITMELMNSCGADFDLDSIEFVATELTRRI